MERIEEIQKRYNDRKYVVTIFGQDHLFAHTDIHHLLSLIETQKKEIEQLSGVVVSARNYFGWMMTSYGTSDKSVSDIENEAEELFDMCVESLKQE